MLMHFMHRSDDLGNLEGDLDGTLAGGIYRLFEGGIGGDLEGAGSLLHVRGDPSRRNVLDGSLNNLDLAVSLNVGENLIPSD